MKKIVAVTGLGAISAIGLSVPEIFQALQNDTGGIGPLTLFQSAHADLPVGEVKRSNEALAEELKCRPHIPRTSLLGIKAAREALASSNIGDLNDWRCGLISATTVGGMDLTENFYPQFLHNHSAGRLRDTVNHSCGSSTTLIADDLSIKGFISTINTACSSSVNSIMLGARMIEEGLLDIAVAGGTDALTRFTLNGFNSLMILDRNLCRPFDASRAGLNLGEGAGFVVLVSEAVLQQADCKAICYVTGFSNTNDAFHQTASSPEGRGSFSAMEKALTMANLAPEDIDYINLHGTGTQNNDLSEGTAVRRLFKTRIPKLSSTKSFTGHTLGASGGMEAVLSALAIQHKCAFANLRFETPIPETDIRPVTKFSPNLRLRHVMSNSFGFGGNCSSIILSSKPR